MKNSRKDRERLQIFAETLAGIFFLWLSQSLTEYAVGTAETQLKIFAVLTTIAGAAVLIHAFLTNRKFKKRHQEEE